MVRRRALTAVIGNSSIVSEHLRTDGLPHVTLPTGEQYLKRIAYLAEVRNRALRPLEDPESPASGITFDKLLYINDVVFDPVDAANLLLSTNVDDDGKAQYRAACATDFIMPFKFYDTFGTRDLEGYSIGVPIFPWFSNAGSAGSRQDVLLQTDAVRVRSCWGGMVAFDALFFQHQNSSTGIKDNFSAGSLTVPGFEGDRQRVVRFRSDLDPFWDSSECCLIHADLQEPRGHDLSAPTGVYINPYVRVAYDVNTLSWLAFTRRFERLYSPIQRFLCWASDMPGYNPRRTEEAGQLVVNRVWVYNMEEWNATGVVSGGYQDVERIAQPGGFCGARKFLALPEGENGAHWFNNGTPDDPDDPSGKGIPVAWRNRTDS